MRVFVEPAVKNELIKESQYFEFVETCETGGNIIPLKTSAVIVYVSVLWKNGLLIL